MNFRAFTNIALATVATLSAACSAAPEDESDRSRARYEGTTAYTTEALGVDDAVVCPAHPPKVENNRLMVWDDAKGAYAEYFVKGMVYSPEASSFGAKAGPAGTLCRESANLGTPDGFFSMKSCFDSDYFGNLMSLDKSRVVNSDFKANWRRDLAVMKEMGVNTLRLYNVDPQFRNHKEFLDDAQAAGMKVIVPAWFLPSNDSPGWPFEENESRGYDLPIKKGVRLQLEEIASHPAVLMWTVGNEAIPAHAEPNQDKDFYAEPTELGKFRLDRINKIVDQLHSVCDGKLLVTHVPQDLGNDASKWESYAKAVPKMDLFMVNSGYRGDIDTSGDYKSLWPIAKDLTTRHNKPLVIGENGEYDHIPLGANWFDSLVKEIRDRQYADANVLGTTFFEYADEPMLKTNFGQNASDEKAMGVVKLVRNPSNPAVDKAEIKQARFDMIKRAFTAR